HKYCWVKEMWPPAATCKRYCPRLVIRFSLQMMDSKLVAYFWEKEPPNWPSSTRTCRVCARLNCAESYAAVAGNISLILLFSPAGVKTMTGSQHWKLGQMIACPVLLTYASYNSGWRKGLRPSWRAPCNAAKPFYARSRAM